jgi:hypothetical protein
MMKTRLLLLVAAVALATPAFAGGHPNGKPSEFYAIQRGTDRKSPEAQSSHVDTRPTASAPSTCTGKDCKRR